jgi:hypothetical protein
MSQRKIVIVLGMHRSGTSLCANMLACLGVDMADTPGASPANRRGHWERPRVNDLHDEVLALFGRAWGDEAHHLALPEGWENDPRTLAVGLKLADWLRPRLSATGSFGFKDPRTSRLLGMWPPILATLNAEPLYVACIRDPAQVARSVVARDRTAREGAEYRWLVYNTQAVHNVGSAPVCILPYEDWFTAPLATARRLASFVGAVPVPDDAALAALVSSTVDLELRHDETAPEPVKPAAAMLHRLIVESRDQGSFSPELRRFAAHLVAMEQSTLPMLREAVSARAGLREQNRVIGDLNALIEKLRRENASLRAAAPQPFALRPATA